jgi:ornithine carbamoyltransferase
MLEAARTIRVPLINAGTGREAPCQALGDMLTIRENRRDLASTRLAYLGPRSGVCHSLLHAAAKAGISMKVATPEGFEPDGGIVQQAESAGQETGFSLQLTQDAKEAVSQADVVYASPWPDPLGDPRAFEPFRVTSDLMALAAPDALLLQGPYLRPGREVAQDVAASAPSAAHGQSENTLHIQKAIVVSYLEDYQRDDE